MKQFIVQVYEIQEPREAEWLVAQGVDHIGSVILSPDEWKRPGIRDVVRLVRQSPAKSSLIPLLPEPDDILRALDYYQPDFVHFCELIPLSAGEDSVRAEVCTRLACLQKRVKKEFPVRIIRSIPVPEPGLDEPALVREAILAIAQALAPSSDLFMTDTLKGFAGPAACQPVAGYVGITGDVCDWELAAALVAESPLPVILAGGISPENVFAALGRVRPAGVDSCTQTNARDALGRPIRFRKDRDRIRRLLDEVRRAEAELPEEGI